MVMDYIKSCAHLTAGVFKQRKEDVTQKYITPVSPALWALFLWDYTYFWIFAMFVYLLVGLCRRLAPAPFATYSHIHNKIILNKPHPSAELYPSLMLLSPFPCMIACKQISPPSPEAIYSFSMQPFLLYKWQTSPT